MAIRQTHRRSPLAVAAALTLAFTLVAAGCSSDSSDDAADAPTTTTAASTETTAPADDSSADNDVEPVDAGRVIAIGEEYVLGDLLALGIKPIASTATVAESGFHSLDDFDTSDIQAMPATEPNLEGLAALAPDHIVILNFFANELGLDQLQATAETVTVIPDGLDPIEQIEFLAEAFGREEAAAELVADYEAAMESAKQPLAGQSVTVAAIYGGPSIAAFIDGPWAVPATLLESGASLVPAAGSLEADRNGRAYLSLEQIELLSGPKLILLTSGLVDGESAAIKQVTESPLWSTLPAVQADAVIELDRLGYPGIVGRTKLVGDLIDALS